MIFRRLQFVVIGAVIGALGAVIAWATIHPAPDYNGTYVPLDSEHLAAAYASSLTVTSVPTTHPSWAVVGPIGVGAGIIITLGVVSLIRRVRAI